MISSGVAVVMSSVSSVLVFVVRCSLPRSLPGAAGVLMTESGKGYRPLVTFLCFPTFFFQAVSHRSGIHSRNACPPYIGGCSSGPRDPCSELILQVSHTYSRPSARSSFTHSTSSQSTRWSMYAASFMMAFPQAGDLRHDVDAYTRLHQVDKDGVSAIPVGVGGHLCGSTPPSPCPPDP